jgi:hypothetical protein
MIACRRTSMILAGMAALALAGCATPDPLEGQRTVFSNPHAAPDATGIGPQCDAARGRDATCLGVPLTRKGRGNTIGAELADAGLTRQQRRILRERAELLKAGREQPPVSPPPPPPIAEDADDTP